MKISVFQAIKGSDSLVRGEKFNSIEIRPNKSTHDFYDFNPSLFFDLPYKLKLKRNYALELF